MPSNPENMVTIHGVKDPGAIPSIGRMVMFQHHDGLAHPAIVLNSGDWIADDPACRVHLKVFTPDGDRIEYAVPFHDGEQGENGTTYKYRTWHWRDRVP